MKLEIRTTESLINNFEACKKSKGYYMHERINLKGHKEKVKEKLSQGYFLIKKK